MNSEPAQNIGSIDVRTLQQRARETDGIDLIDVRTPAEFREVHSVHARNVPLDQLHVDQLRAGRPGREGSPLYVICNSGGRSTRACEKIAHGGVANVVNVTGGTKAWVEAGLPVVRGQKSISLERQVRITAGALVLAGAGLGYFIHPLWIGLPAFVGAGLMFAGLTDTCGMAMVLARMPWNKVSDKSQ